MMDHRCYLRSSAHIPAFIRVNGRWMPAIIRNVSEGGLYVETPSPLAKDRYAMVTVRPRNQPDDAHGGDVPALIVHRSESGVGLMVAAVDSDHWLSTTLRESDSGNTSAVDFKHLW